MEFPGFIVEELGPESQCKNKALKCPWYVTVFRPHFWSPAVLQTPCGLCFSLALTLEYAFRPSVPSRSDLSIGMVLLLGPCQVWAPPLDFGPHTAWPGHWPGPAHLLHCSQSQNWTASSFSVLRWTSQPSGLSLIGTSKLFTSLNLDFLICISTPELLE